MIRLCSWVYNFTELNPLSKWGQRAIKQICLVVYYGSSQKKHLTD